MTGANNNDDVTAARLDDLREYIKEGFAQINTRFDNLKVVDQGAYDAHREAYDARFKNLEEDVKEMQKREWGNVKMALGSVGTIAAAVLGSIGATKGL